MTSRVGRAHGKVILLGEHAVVYGCPAIAVGIERGARAEAEPLGPGEPPVLDLAGEALVADPLAKDDRARAFAALLGLGEGAPADLAFSGPAVRVRASSDLPAGGGLGSSAALGVAIARSLSSFDAPADRVLARATAWERVFHGNPSGIDTAAAARGGCLRFSRDHGVTLLFPAVDVWLAVGSTGTASSTRAMVESVARQRARRPELVDGSIDAIRALVENAALALEAGDLTGLGKLMDLNQMLLAGLMLSNEAIEQLCALARGAGALGAKLTGAGGGGSVVALLASPDDGESVLAAFRAGGFEGFTTVVRARPRGDEEAVEGAAG